MSQFSRSHSVLAASTLIADLPGRTVQLWVDAPEVAHNWRPGQFVIVRTSERGERIPFTIVDGDSGAGAICLVVQEVGKSTRDIAALRAGDAIEDVCGPLGVPSRIERFGTCVVSAGGYGAAAVLPIARSLARSGNRVIGVVGVRTARLLILTDELEGCTETLAVATEDGSRGSKGSVLVPLEEVLATHSVDRVVTIGPVAMMRAVADMTRPSAIPTVASLNPIMLDGTGMCGACRVHVDDTMRFACVDGPEFDAHAVDFDELAARLGTFRAQEHLALENAIAAT